MVYPIHPTPDELVKIEIEGGPPALFLLAGIDLPIASRPDREAAGYATLGHPLRAAGWVLYRAPHRAEAPPLVIEPYQATLDLTPRNGPLATYIPPSCSAFMSGRICSYFRASRRRACLARYLRCKGIVYLGDLTRMNVREALSLLGPYAGMLPELEAYLKQIGLSLGAMAPWWLRPAMVSVG